MAGLVLLRNFLPADTIFDLRYKTAHNIAGRPLYPADFEAQLQETAAQALALAAKNLQTLGLRLVVWDGYRPQAVQTSLQTINQDERYVAKQSYHCQGVAIDATLADKSGRYLDMGTDLDEFGPKTHVDYADLEWPQMANRANLAAAMLQAGFTSWPYEWWHFNYLAT